MDMELCDLSLDDYINCRSTFLTQRPTLLNEPVFVSQDCSIQAQVLNIWTIMHQISQGIEFIHDKNHSHRDLKPANGMRKVSIILTLVLYSHQKKKWKITDFGLASVATSKKAVTTRYSRGTEGYRAPELLQEDAKFTKMVDIWALACILYELTTGKKAFRNDFIVREFRSVASLEDTGSGILQSIESHLFECLREMLNIDPQRRPRIITLRRLFESGIILDQLIEHIFPTPRYGTLGHLAVQDTEDLVFGLCDWYESQDCFQAATILLDALDNSSSQPNLQVQLPETTRSSDVAKNSSRDSGGESTVGGNIRWRIATLKGQKNVIESLLMSGVDVNAVNGAKQTALHYASKFGPKDIVELLMTWGANVNASDSNGRTPLHLAVEGDQIKIVQLLLKTGANVNPNTYPYYRTPLVCATRDGRDKLVELLLKAGADLRNKDGNGLTPLLFAARYGLERVVELFLEAGADFNEKDHSGCGPISHAAVNGNVKVVELLLKAGADFSETDYRGWGPISLAAQYGREKVVELLLKAGADVNQIDNDGWEPIIWAAKNGHGKVVELLSLAALREHEKALEFLDAKPGRYDGDDPL
jgi:ankyrin repeat protein